MPKIQDLTELSSPADGDFLPIVDVDASNEVKKIQKSNLASPLVINALDEKTSLHNDDLFIIEDSEASNAKKKVKKSNLGGSSDIYVMGVGSTLARTYYNFTIPWITTGSITNAIWTISGHAINYQYHFCRLTSISGASYAVTNLKTPDDVNVSFASKKVIVEFTLKVDVSNGQAGFGLAQGAAAYQTYNEATQDAACFTVDTAGNLYAHTSNGGGGASHTETQITGITLTDLNTYRIEHNPGVDAKFYVNGVLKATITTNLPNGNDILIGYGSGANTTFINRCSFFVVSLEK